MKFDLLDKLYFICSALSYLILVCVARSVGLMSWWDIYNNPLGTTAFYVVYIVLLFKLSTLINVRILRGPLFPSKDETEAS